jgi:hypothetical protein
VNDVSKLNRAAYRHEERPAVWFLVMAEFSTTPSGSEASAGLMCEFGPSECSLGHGRQLYQQLNASVPILSQRRKPAKFVMTSNAL